jgi:hypothetical protein
MSGSAVLQAAIFIRRHPLPCEFGDVAAGDRLNGNASYTSEESPLISLSILGKIGLSCFSAQGL